MVHGKMKYLLRVLSVFTLLACPVSSTSLEWPYPRLSQCISGSLCTCSYSPNFEEHIFCPNVTVFIGAYMFSRHTVIVTCKEDVQDPSVFSVLSDVSLAGNYDTLRVVNCPMPNSSFADIFSGGARRFKRLEIDSRTDYSIDVRKTPFEKLHQLTVLVLRIDRLNLISNDSFEDLEDLYSISLVLNDYNGFGLLSNELFINRTNLEMVHIIGNINKALSLDDITPTVNDLVYRSGESNYSYSFPRDFFWNLRSLSEVTLSNCRIDHFHQDTFTNSSFVGKLDLKHNLLTKLEADMFKGLENLARLDLSHNQISYLPEGIFNFNKKLIWLSLNNNRLEVIPSSTFLHTPSLWIMDLSWNRLKEISENQFLNLKKLGYLDLSNNQLTSLTSANDNQSVLRNCKEIWSLDLSNNSLTTMYRDWRTELNNLKLLNLSHNDFSHLEIKDFQFSSNVSLDLSHNQVEFIDVSALDSDGHFYENSTQGFTSVLLNNNPYNCNCSLLTFIKDVLEDPASTVKKHWNSTRLTLKEESIKELKCSQPKELENEALINVTKSEFFKSLKCLVEDKSQGNVTVTN